MVKDSSGFIRFGTFIALFAKLTYLIAICMGSKTFSFLARITFSTHIWGTAVFSNKSTCGRRQVVAAAISGDLVTDQGLNQDIQPQMPGEGSTLPCKSITCTTWTEQHRRVRRHHGNLGLRQGEVQGLSWDKDQSLQWLRQGAMWMAPLLKEWGKPRENWFQSTCFSFVWTPPKGTSKLLLLRRHFFLVQNSLTLHTLSMEKRAKPDWSFAYRHRNIRIPHGPFLVLSTSLSFKNFILSHKQRIPGWMPKHSPSHCLFH